MVYRVRFALLAVLCAAVLAAIAAAPAAAGSTHWTWQSSSNGDLWDVSFVGDVGWAVDGGDHVLHTVDGGLTWSKLPTGEDDALYGVQFVSPAEGWVVGEWGAVLHTTDGGVTWERQASRSISSLYDIEFIDADHGWALGLDTLLATTDGGATWKLQLGEGSLMDWDWFWPEAMMYGVAFADAQHGCVVGIREQARQEEDYAGVAWSTSDGGATWTETRVSGVSSLYAVTVYDGMYWAAGGDNTIAHSPDGVHWTRDTMAAPVYLTGIAMTSAGGWAVGYGESDDWFSDSYLEAAIVLRSGDGGATWEPVVDPLFDIDPPLSVRFESTAHGRMLAESGTMYVTDDGGDSWSVVGEKPMPAVAFEAITQAPDGMVWAVGNTGDDDGDEGGTGVVWRSADSGATWEPLDHPLFDVAGFTQVVAAAGGEAWVAGDGGRILHTTDAGQTWRRQPTGVGSSFTGLAFSDAEHGWAVSPGLRGTVLRTSDGGDHWQLTKVGDRERYFTVLASAADVWLGGMAYRSDCEEEGPGLVAHSTDGGATWTTVPAGPRAVLRLAMPGGGQGWAVSGPSYWWDAGGVLLHTTDDGATWTQTKAGPKGTVRRVLDVFFADPLEGWALAISGDYEQTLVLHTVDGGAHWGAVRIDDAWDLRTIWFSGRDDGWVAGRNAILATTDGGGIAPMSVCNAMWGPKWVRKAFTFKVETADDGLGLAPTQTRLGDGPWEDAAKRTIRAPRSHANDGYHLIRYRGVDLAGNREEVNAAPVVVDTRPPRLVTRDRARARAMRRGTLRLKVHDALSPAVRVTIDVFDKAGKRLRRARAMAPTDGVWHAVRYNAAYPAGKYRMVVRVSDYAGNRCERPRTLVLTVRK